MIRSFTSSEELKIRTITVSKPLNLAVHWPSKVWPVGMITDDCSTVEKNLKKLITPLDRKKYLNLVFYDNRNLKISNSKKSERYFRDKIEIFIRLVDELFVRHRYHRFPWRNLPPPHPHPLACKLYASCACCVNIKFRVHVYNVFAWISLHSLLAVAVSVCRFSFASVTEQWQDDIYNTGRNWKHQPSLILHSKLVLYEGWLGNKKICILWIYERNEHGKNWTQNVPFGHLKFRCLLF